MSSKAIGAAVGTALAVIIAAITITISVGGGGGHGVTVTLGGPHGTPTTTVTVPEHAVDVAKETDLDNHQHLRSEEPAGVPQQLLERVQKQQDALAQNDQLPAVTPDAAPQQRGCVTRLVQNYSSRRGVAPRLFVLHYTVSPNRPGWSDVYAVASLFDRAAFAASSNYIIDNEGHCLYIVRESDKAWTQAAANPVAVSVEVINSGHEPTYAAKAGLKKIGLVAHDVAKRWQFPLQRGVVAGCLVVRPGIVQHKDLGACGGGHFDISPFSVAPVIAAAKAYGASTLPKPPPPPATGSCTVKSLQNALHLTADGQLGPRTRAAIKALQRKNHIPVTGYAGTKVSKILHLKNCHY